MLVYQTVINQVMSQLSACRGTRLCQRRGQPPNVDGFRRRQHHEILRVLV